MGANSILEGMDCKVTVKEYPYKEENTTIHDATFLEFSTDFEELGDNVGQFPAAIVLLSDGNILATHVANVRIIFDTVDSGETIKEETVEKCPRCHNNISDIRCVKCGFTISED